MKRLPTMHFGDWEVPLPIIQGGMGVGISLSGLASAVANEGGIGVISSAGVGTFYYTLADKIALKDADREGLKREIRKARTLTKGRIGVNIMAALTDFSQLLRCAIEEKADFVFMGAGLPLWDPKEIPETLLQTSQTKLIPIVSSAKGASVIVKYWLKKNNRLPDGFVLEGPLAGGHLGFKPSQIEDPQYQLEQILPPLIELTKDLEKEHGRHIPVIAGGGIFSGSDIRRMLELGAEGVQMSTRFVGTDECDASLAFKEAYVQCKPEDIMIIQSPVGLPGRAIRNEFIQSIQNGHKKPFTCPYQCLRTCDFINAPYCIAMALTNAQKGLLDEGFAFCGANAHRVDKIRSVKELIQVIQEEYAQTFETGLSTDSSLK